MDHQHEKMCEYGNEFIENALHIRENKLYRGIYKTFDEFMQTRFNKTRQWLSQQKARIEVLDNLSIESIGVSCALVLAPLGPEEQRDAWLGAIRTFDTSSPTVAHIKDSVQRLGDSKDTISMGWVYVIYNGYDAYKIGSTTRREIDSRVSEMQTANARKLEVVAAIETENPRGLETEIQREFKDKRTFQGGSEWFLLNHEDLREILLNYGDEKWARN